MKICFFLQRRFAYIGHAMACHIKEFSPNAEFCALVQARSSWEYLKAQQEIKYTSMIFGEDIYRTLYDEKIDYEYLRWFEQEYGIPNLWPYLYIDRIVMNGQFLREYPHNHPTLSYEDMLRCLQVNAKAIIAFLEAEKPDSVVISVVGTVASVMLYHIAQKKGIQTINIEFARIGNRIAFSEDDRTFTWVQKRFHEIEKGASSTHTEAAKKFLQEFRKNPAAYDIDIVPEFYEKKGRLAAFRFLHPAKLIWSIPWHIKAVKADILKRKNNDYIDSFIWWALWDKMKRKTRSFIGFSDLYTKPDWKQRFAYFPLHIEPEVALMRYAPYYTNQQEVIRAIAHALPIDMLLYVKEHPGMAGFRTREYYKEILKIPNVRLINPYIPGTEVARHAAITTTITSTSAWEAIMLEKPVITFGNVFFNDIPGVKRCDGFEELPYLIKEQLETWRGDDKILINYISALLEDSVAVDFSAMWNEAAPFERILKDEGMINLSRLLAKKIKTAK